MNDAIMSDWFLYQKTVTLENAHCHMCKLSFGFFHKYQWCYLHPFYLSHLALYSTAALVCVFLILVSRDSFCSVMHNRVQRPRRHMAPGVSTELHPLREANQTGRVELKFCPPTNGWAIVVPLQPPIFLFFLPDASVMKTLQPFPTKNVMDAYGSSNL